MLRNKRVNMSDDSNGDAWDGFPSHLIIISWEPCVVSSINRRRGTNNPRDDHIYDINKLIIDALST